MNDSASHRPIPEPLLPVELHNHPSLSICSSPHWVIVACTPMCEPTSHPPISQPLLPLELHVRPPGMRAIRRMPHALSILRTYHITPSLSPSSHQPLTHPSRSRFSQLSSTSASRRAHSLSDASLLTCHPDWASWRRRSRSCRSSRGGTTVGHRCRRQLQKCDPTRTGPLGGGVPGPAAGGEIAGQEPAQL
jgi:hypothetical protein